MGQPGRAAVLRPDVFGMAAGYSYYLPEPGRGLLFEALEKGKGEDNTKFWFIMNSSFYFTLDFYLGDWNVFAVGPRETYPLKWSIEGLSMKAGQQVGTSNEASSLRVSMGFDRDGALLILERQYLDALLTALTLSR